VSAAGPDLARRPLLGALSPATLRALQPHVVERRFRVGELLLEGGVRAEWLHVLDEGLVREFYVTADGSEHTRVFASEGGVTGSLLDLTSDLPSVTWIQALEPTRTLAIRFAALNALAAQHGELQALARRHAEALAVRKTKREYEMLALSASERLASWRAEHPHLDGRITRRLLASYLGITPVHLSRISSRAPRSPRGAPPGKARPQR
jgi:CRP-like cAMP-binding protein